MEQTQPGAPPESPTEPQPPPVVDPPADSGNREPVIDEPGREVPAIDPRVPGTPRKIHDPKPNPENPGQPGSPSPTPISQV